MKEHIRGAAVAGRVRLLRAAHPQWSFVLVEGDDDASLYRKFTHPALCHVRAAYGKPRVLEAIDDLARSALPGVLAIVDADFSALEGARPSLPNVLWTDHHDLEAGLIASPALERVLLELGHKEETRGFRGPDAGEVRTRLLEIGLVIGHLRWLSKREGLSLYFDDLPFEKLIHDKTLAFEEAALLAELQSRSRQGALVHADIRAKIEAMKQAGAHDPWHVCCGHDLVGILAVGLRRVWGANKESEVTPAKLEKDLRLAYERADFEQTRLRAAIQAWEQASPPYVVLAA